MYHLRCFYFLSFPMCLSAQHQYALSFHRSGSTVILMCHNESSGSNIDVEMDSSIDFFVNRSRGDRIDDQPTSLSVLLSRMARRLERIGRAASFQMTPELEGYYSCGTRTTESFPIPLLVCKFINLKSCMGCCLLYQLNIMQLYGGVASHKTQEQIMQCSQVMVQ